MTEQEFFDMQNVYIKAKDLKRKIELMIARDKVLSKRKQFIPEDFSDKIIRPSERIILERQIKQKLNIRMDIGKLMKLVREFETLKVNDKITNSNKFAYPQKPFAKLLLDYDIVLNEPRSKFNKETGKFEHEN